MDIGSDFTGLSDGCTGFWWAERLFPIRECCAVHDAGGTDGVLLDCLMSATPGWSWPLVAFCVAGMIFWRPVYERLQRLRRTK